MSELEQVIQEERKRDLRGALKAISSKMVLPLFSVFWICDLLYIPEKKWEFLGLRATIIPLFFITRWFLRKDDHSFNVLQRYALFYVFSLVLPIIAMIVLAGSWSSPYYAGLNLIALGSLSFIPWTTRYFYLCIAFIFVPFYLSGFFISGALNEAANVLVNSFFVGGTISISFVIRMFNNKLRRKEIESRIQLRNELTNRDTIIKEKTEEAVKLAALSNQFSPQVVDAIKNGKIDFVKGVQRAQICAVFIDIVNSTERVVRVDKDKVSKALAMFMEDTIKTLLKYDITVDKFLGDGVLAFCNDPIKYTDYVDRVVQAALEVRKRIGSRQDTYIDFWLNEMQVRIGIAVGFANVGFYGNDRFYKSYTAIGPVINMASRLCAIAEPNQIVVTSDVLEKLQENYSVKPLGVKTLKGFEADLIKVFEINQGAQPLSSLYEIDCNHCETGLLYLDSDEDGIFVLKCRSCGHIQREAVLAPTGT